MDSMMVTTATERDSKDEREAFYSKTRIDLTQRNKVLISLVKQGRRKEQDANTHYRVAALQDSRSMISRQASGIP